MNLDFSKLEGFEWNKGNLDHIKKHKVGYKECEEVFISKPIIIKKDLTHSKYETRYRVLGKTFLERRLYIVYTIREKYIRIITARDLNKKEQEKYKKQEVKYEYKKI